MPRLRLPSPALMASVAAMGLAIGGTAYASQHYLLNSTKQIAPNVLRSLRGRSGPRGREGVAGRMGGVGPAGPAGPAGPQGPGATRLSFSGATDEDSQPITKTFFVDGYTYTNRCGVDPRTPAPTDSITVTGPWFDIRGVSETMNNGASELDSPSFFEEGPTTSVQLADATGSDDSHNVAVVSPAELTNLATGATQTISLIAESAKNMPGISCDLSGTVTPGN